MSAQSRVAKAGWSQRLALPAALAGLIALAAWPLLRAGYPTIGDGLIHYYRLVQLDLLLREGVWFPRWATDLAYGFGYPVFNYYSPLSYYSAALLHAAGLDYAQALLGVYALALALAITGAYALAAARWGPAAGLTAAAAFGLAPYLYFNALARGALPETLGLGLLPWVLWAYARLAQRPAPASFALAALLNAALILTHLLTAMLAAPLLVLFVVMEAVAERGGRSEVGNQKRAADRGANYHLLITNYLLSLLLSGFFLFPAVLELGAVQVGQLTQPGDLDFHNNFLQIADLLAWPRPYDARLVFNAVPPSLSLMAALVAVVGWLAGRRMAAGRPPRLGEGTLLGVALTGLALLTLPVSAWVWERLPLLEMVQFPWRLVGPASLLLALLAGAGVGRRPPRGRGRLAVVLAVVLGAVWVFSLTWSFGPASQAPGTAGLADLRAYERASGQLGTTSTGEFLPVAVRALPDPHALEAAYASGRPTQRLSTAPAGVTILSQSAHATGATAEIEAATPAVLTFDFFHFPGWHATVDSQPAAITPSEPHGLITVDVPAGRHRLEVRFGATPLRATAAWLSGLSALGLLVITQRLARPAAHAPPHPPTLAYPHTPTLVFAATALLLLAARAVLLDGRDTPFARSRFNGATVAGAQQALDANFDDQLVLMGLDGPPESVAADEAVPLTLYWRAQTAPTGDYAATVQVLDAAGHLYGQSDSQHPGRVPTSRWGAGQYARDEHRLRLLPGTPPGTYRLVAGVYAVGGPALPVLDAARVPQGQLAPLGTLTVTPARQPAVPDAAQAMDANLGALSLVGYSLNTTTPQAGDVLGGTFFWRAEGAARPDAAVQLSLVSAAGAVLYQAVHAPAPANHPTSAWAAGEVVRAPWDLRVPAVAPEGPARLQVSLVPAGNPASAPLAGPVTVATLDLRVPARRLSVPAMAQVLDAPLNSQVTLLGYDLAPEGQLTLYWQPQAPLNASYKVFVHVLGEGEQILAQADSVPAGGARPTTGWLPGEVVADTHHLPLAGARQIAVGLYAEASGERLGRILIALP